MRSVIITLLAMLILPKVCQSQSTVITNTTMFNAGVTASSGPLNLPVGWTELQDVFSVAITSGCTTGTAACSFDVLPTTAGSVWVIVAVSANNTHIASASSVGGGGTWTLCPTSECNTFNASAGAIDAIYNLGGAANTQNVTVTLNASATGFYDAAFIELLPPPGQTASFDTAGATASTACTTCTGVALTTSATDFVLQFADNFGTATSSNPCSSPYYTDNFNQCIGLNIASGSLTAPTFTQTPSDPMAWTALAFKSSAAGFTVTTPLFSLVHYTSLAGAVGEACNPTCSVTIPSTTAGTLLFVAAGAGTASSYISSITDGGDTFTNCSGANITTTASAQAMSCAYVLSGAGGKITLSVTMAANATVGFGVYEVSRTVGSFTLDAQGSTQRTVSLPYLTGQTLSLTGTNDACFQGAYNAGGTSSATQYLTPFTFGASGGVYILNTQVSEQILLGTYYGSFAGTGGSPIWVTNQNVASAVNGWCAK
jgi:hypothetical protein